MAVKMEGVRTITKKRSVFFGVVTVNGRRFVVGSHPDLDQLRLQLERSLAWQRAANGPPGVIDENAQDPIEEEGNG